MVLSGDVISMLSSRWMATVPLAAIASPSSQPQTFPLGNLNAVKDAVMMNTGWMALPMETLYGRMHHVECSPSNSVAPRVDVGFDHAAVPPVGLVIGSFRRQESSSETSEGVGRGEVASDEKKEENLELNGIASSSASLLSSSSSSPTTTKSDGPRIIDASYAKHGVLGFAIASAGPALACFASNPFDVVKTRMQLQNELERYDPARYRFSSSWDCLMKTWRSEGIRGLQRGLSISILREGSKNLFRIGLFHPVLSRLSKDPQRASIPVRMLAGGVSGCVAAIVCNPVEVIKTRMQSQGSAITSVGVQRDYRGIRDAAKKIYHNEGVSVFWKGVGVSTLRSVMATAVHLSAFTALKDAVLLNNIAKDTPFVDASCSALSAVSAVLVQHPIDLVRTRVYNQPFHNGVGTMYGNSLQATRRIFRMEGLRGFYKGLGSHLFRTVPHFVLSFVFMGEMQRISVKFAQDQENIRWAQQQARLS